jgi:hypothetical protein
MAAMLQLLTYLLGFYLVVEILQIALALSKENRAGIIALGVLVLIACMVAAGAFVALQGPAGKSTRQHNAYRLIPNSSACVSFRSSTARTSAFDKGNWKDLNPPDSRQENPWSHCHSSLHELCATILPKSSCLPCGTKRSTGLNRR